MMIKIVYIDGSAEEFKQSGYYLYTQEDEDEDTNFVEILKNKFHPDDDDFDEDDSSIIVKISRSQIRKIEYID